MIRIGVISDTHVSAFEDLPKKLIQGLQGANLILHAGDLVNPAVLAGLKKITSEVYAVWGNMDPPNIKRVLSNTEIIQVKEFRIGLTHGAGSPLNLIKTVKEKFEHERVDCIVYGHSHSPCNEVHQGILYFNPGSPTDKVYAAYNSYGILEIDKEIVGKIIKI